MKSEGVNNLRVVQLDFDGFSASLNWLLLAPLH